MKIIINADDYGWDEDANQGILTLVRAGALSSLSIMANMADDYALKNMAIHTNTVSTGIHVTLNEGKPVSNPIQIRSLLDKNGCFFSSSELLRKFSCGYVKPYHIELEIRNQIGRLRDFGIDISHADSHQHLHQYPFLGKIILSVLQKEGIKKVRRCLPETTNDFRRKVLNGFHFLSKNNLKPFKSPELLVTSFAHQTDANLTIFESSIQELQKRKISVAEFMCHPALSNREDSYLNRKAEFDFLFYAPWQDILDAEGIEWVNYKNL